MKEIAIGDYVRLKNDKSQIFKVTALNEEVVVVTSKNESPMFLKYPDIELGDDNDMTTYEENQSIFVE